MSKKILIALLVGLVVLVSMAPALAAPAKGIIKSDSGYDGAGTIVVTEGGGPGEEGISPGGAVSFAEPLPRDTVVGDLVTFTVALDSRSRSAVAKNIVKIADGTVIEADASGDLVVGPGETLTIRNGATVTGNVSVGGGNLLITGSSTVNGVLTGESGSFLLVEEGSEINEAKLFAPLI